MSSASAPCKALTASVKPGSKLQPSKITCNRQSPTKPRVLFLQTSWQAVKRDSNRGSTSKVLLKFLGLLERVLRLSSRAITATSSLSLTAPWTTSFWWQENSQTRVTWDQPVQYPLLGLDLHFARIADAVKESSWPAHNVCQPTQTSAHPLNWQQKGAHLS